MSFAMPDSDSMKPMKMNIGRVSMGYQLKSLIAALKSIAELPSPHRNNAAATPTNPIAANTLCPVSIRSISVENISRIIISGEKLISILLSYRPAKIL